MQTESLAVVFVVDDEKVIAKTLEIILNRNGFAAFAFTDPTEALSSARGMCPDLVISDVMMPQMSGVEMAIRLKQHCTKVKILLFSGQAATSDLLEDARKMGHHFDILSKPVHPTDLIDAVRQLRRG